VGEAEEERREVVAIRRILGVWLSKNSWKAFPDSYKPTGRSAVITVNWPEAKRGVGFTVELNKGDLP